MRRTAQAVLPFEGRTPSPTGPDTALTRAVLPTLGGSSARALGAYYTPPIAAQFLARWALRGRGERILEPSMGDGAFLQALRLEDSRRALSAEVWGVEMATDTFELTATSGLIEPGRAIRDDFLSVSPFDVDAVVGNPPYVRLRHLPPDQARLARDVAERALDEPMDPSGSVWMPFVLHATRFLAPGGRLALVLPYELTYVRYARPLWRFLGSRFGSLRVVRVHERMFGDLLQETVLLLANDYGQRTQRVLFEAYETVAQLESGRPAVTTEIEVADIVGAERAFLLALLSDEARGLLRTTIAAQTVPARDLVTFNIGYVCGDKRFFHPTRSTVTAYELRPDSLLPALTSARQLRGVGLRTRSLPLSRFSQLFLPGGDLTASEQDYVEYGASLGVSERYKCRTRDPWYVTPYVKVPDVLLPVFSEKPALLINDARVVASNSLLCGYLKGPTAETFASAWFTSLTLLQLELQVHALGGGVMVLVPREAGSIRLPSVSGVARNRLELLHALLADEKLDLAFESGNEPVLVEALGLSSADVAAIQEAAATLAHWRTAARTSSHARIRSGEDVEEEQASFQCIDYPVDES